MNKERLEEVALWLEAGAPERKFNMNRLLDMDTKPSEPENWCGTECCIAGYVATRYEPLKVNRFDLEGQATRLLGLEPRISDALFYPQDLETNQQISIQDRDWSDITPAQAALAVRNVMNFNDPKWKEVLNLA